MMHIMLGLHYSKIISTATTNCYIFPSVDSYNEGVDSLCPCGWRHECARWVPRQGHLWATFRWDDLVRQQDEHNMEGNYEDSVYYITSIAAVKRKLPG